MPRRMKMTRKMKMTKEDEEDLENALLIVAKLQKLAREISSLSVETRPGTVDAFLLAT